MNLTELAMSYKFVKQTSGGGSGGGSGIIDVTELPTENIDENAVYRVKGYTDVDCGMLFTEEGFCPLSSLLQFYGINANITYYMVEDEDLPETANISDVMTFSTLHVYIIEDIPCVYGDPAGDGNRWLPLAALLQLENGGYLSSTALNNGNATKLYVTYKKNATAISDKTYVCQYDTDIGEYVNYYDLYINSLSLAKRIKNLVIPNGLEYINHYAFYDAKRLESITFTNGLLAIGISAFAGSGLKGKLILPSGLQRMDAYAFKETSIEEVFIPASVTECNDSVFAMCKSLKKVVLEEGFDFDYYSDELFYGCTALEIVDIPHSVTNLPQHTFFDCTNITFNYNGTKAEWNAIDKRINGWGYDIGDFIVICTDGTIAKDGTET